MLQDGQLIRIVTHVVEQLLDQPTGDRAFADDPAIVCGFGCAAARTTTTAQPAAEATLGGVEYRFEETTGSPGGDDSKWQKYPTFRDEGLRGIMVLYTTAGCTYCAEFVKRNEPKYSVVVPPQAMVMGRHRLAFAACNVFDKESQSLNSYAHRHFICIAGSDGKRPTVTRQQWYGGSISWFPDSSALLHFEFDSTGGPPLPLELLDAGRPGRAGEPRAGHRRPG